MLAFTICNWNPITTQLTTSHALLNNIFCYKCCTSSIEAMFPPKSGTMAHTHPLVLLPTP